MAEYEKPTALRLDSNVEGQCRIVPSKSRHIFTATKKKTTKKCTAEKKDLRLFLHNYKNTPVAASTYSSSQLLMSQSVEYKITRKTNGVETKCGKPKTNKLLRKIK